MTTQISVPENVLHLSGLAQDALPRYLLELLVLDIFRQRKLSLGKSAEILGLCYNDFIDLAGDHDIPIAEYEPEDLQNETEAWERYQQKINGKN